MRRYITFGILAFCVLSWGSSYVAIKVGLASFLPFQVAAYRFGVAGLISVFLLLIQKPPLPSFKQWLQIIGISFWGIFIYHTAITYFTVYFEPNVVSFVSNTAPIFMIALSRVFLNERLNHIRWIFFVTAVIGIGIMNFDGNMHMTWKELGLFTIPISSALFFVLQKKLLQEMQSSTMMHLCIIVGALMLISWDHSIVSEFKSAELYSHLAIIYLGIVPTIMAFLLWSLLLSSSELSHISAYIYLVPASTILFSYLWLEQLPKAQTIIGGALTIISVISIQKRNE